MKRQIAAIIVGLTFPVSVFCVDFSLSAGVGGLFGSFFSRYTLTANGIIQGAENKIDSNQEVNQLNYGFFVFVDATYAEFNVFYQNGAYTYREGAAISALRSDVDQSGRGWDSALGFSLLGKYPFQISPVFNVFPLLGLEYEISLKQRRTQADGFIYSRNDGMREFDKDNKGYTLADWNSFWIKLGGGADFRLAGNFFLRGELLYGFRLMTSYETKNLEYMKAMSGDDNPKLGGITSGPSLRISAGYRFF